MARVPRLLGIALVGLMLAGGSCAALADDTTSSDNGLTALPPFASSSSPDLLLPADGSLGAPAQKFDLQNGHFDFFSIRPKTSSGDFTSLLQNGGAGGAGLKFQLNW